MWSPRRIRTSGTAAVGSSLLGVLAAPLMNSAFALTGWSGPNLGFWEPTLRTLAGPLLSFAAPSVMYATYGGVIAVAFVGQFVGTLGLRAYLQRHTIDQGRITTVRRWGVRLVVVGTGLLAAGSATEYWVGSLPGFGALQSIGFFVTVIATLVLAFGYPLLGLAGLRTGYPPRWLAWAFIGWFPGALIINAVGFNNIPANPALVVGMLGILFGIYLRQSPSFDSSGPYFCYSSLVIWIR